MPVQVTYPGVYVEEIPGGSHTISGVATSITAFMGRAVCGPLGQLPAPDGGPITIFSFQDYQNIFGGLSHDSPMSYAVRDFFLNGGGQATIVRLFEQVSNPPAPPPPLGVYTAQFALDAPAVSSPPFASPLDFAPPPAGPAGRLALQAANPGTWGNYLVAMVDFPPAADLPKILDAYAQYGVRPGDPVFNLTVYYNPPSGKVRSERYLNLTVTGGTDNPNRIDHALRNQSALARTNPPTLTEGFTPGPDWATEWRQFNDALGKSNLNQAQLLASLPGPNMQGWGTAATADSDPITAATFAGDGQAALDQVDLFNLLCVPPEYGQGDASDCTALAVATQMLPYCVKRRAMMILDPLVAWSEHVRQDRWDLIQPTDYKISGDEERNAAVYFPRLIEADPLMKNQPMIAAPCGAVAGVIASTDLARGVWKAPAGTEAGVNNVLQLEYAMTDDQNGMLNPLGINCLRTFPVFGSVVWGARTLRGASEFEDDYKYLNVRRLALYVEESVYRGTKWAAFEPNDATLWGSLTTSINAFLDGLRRQGAFYSFFVRCDATMTTPADIDLGIVNILVGIAPAEPAEFVVVSVRQQALRPSS